MEKLIKDIMEMLAIPSISGHQPQIDQMLNWVKQKMAPYPVKIREFRYEGAAPVLLLANCESDDFDILTIGHLDVVPAKDELFIPRTDGNCLFGRGSSDMKSQIAVNLNSLLYSLGKNIRFAVMITTDEETTSNGMKAIAAHRKISAKIVFDNDAGSLDTLIEKYKHPVSVEIRAAGENAHSSRPWDGINAVNRLTDCIAELEKEFPRYEKGIRRPENEWCDTMVLTALNSPTTYNVVPAEATARLNFRLTERTPLARLEHLLQEACGHHGCLYTILLSSRGVYMDADHPIIRNYLQIAEAATGRKIGISTMGGATDSRMFADNSVIVMHGVNGGNIHGDNEYVEIDSVLKLAEIQQRFIDACCRGEIY